MSSRKRNGTSVKGRGAKKRAIKNHRAKKGKISWQIQLHKRITFPASSKRLLKLIDAIVDEISANKILSHIRRGVSPAPESFVDKSQAGRTAKSKVLGLNSVDIGIYFLGTGEARKLNKAYRGKNYATDVLSFEGNLSTLKAMARSEFSSDEPLLGELVFCVPVLKRQAREHGLTQRQEFEYLFIHGILHLLGYDHEKSQARAQKMFKIQDRLFEEFCC